MGLDVGWVEKTSRLGAGKVSVLNSSKKSGAASVSEMCCAVTWHPLGGAPPTHPLHPSTPAGLLLQPGCRQRALGAAGAPHQAARWSAATGALEGAAGRRRACSLAFATCSTLRHACVLMPTHLPGPSPLQFAPAPPPYCCDDDELPARAGRPSAACTSRSEAYGPPPSHQQQQRPNTASRRALEGQGVAAALRHDEVVAPRGSSFSAATGYSGMQGGYAASYGASSAAAAAQARPQTAPVAAQRQYPWSWGGPQ